MKLAHYHINQVSALDGFMGVSLRRPSCWRSLFLELMLTISPNKVTHLMKSQRSFLGPFSCGVTDHRLEEQNKATDAKKGGTHYREGKNEEHCTCLRFYSESSLFKFSYLPAIPVGGSSISPLE